MATLGAQPKRIVAGIGPAICQRSYEVGPEFPAPFLEKDARNADFFCPAPRPGHFHFDLKGYVARRLAGAGVSTIQTPNGRAHLCTSVNNPKHVTTLLVTQK